mmetsp:Transcript_99527/g.310083  ORF Transcript_99527/g.310083 Transcript_99527/m.310083 type:complete len:316 (+) Transcript_99527:92-1039(+)
MLPRSLEAVHSPIRRSPGRALPAVERPWCSVEDLHDERVARRCVVGVRCAAVATRARGQQAEEVDLCEEFEEVARAHGRRLHEVLVRVPAEASAHEDVEDVMDEELRLCNACDPRTRPPAREAGATRALAALRAQQCAQQVRVAAAVIVGAPQHRIGVGVAARANDVVHTGTVPVIAIPIQRVVRDGRHRPQVRQRRPEPVARRDVRRMQLARLAREEALREVVRVIQVEVADLRALAGHDAEELPGAHLESAGVPRWHHDLPGQSQVAPRPLVQRGVVRRQQPHPVACDRPRSAPLGRVGRLLGSPLRCRGRGR